MYTFSWKMRHCLLHIDCALPMWIQNAHVVLNRKYVAVDVCCTYLNYSLYLWQNVKQKTWSISYIISLAQRPASSRRLKYSFLYCWQYTHKQCCCRCIHTQSIINKANTHVRIALYIHQSSLAEKSQQSQYSCTHHTAHSRFPSSCAWPECLPRRECEFYHHLININILSAILILNPLSTRPGSIVVFCVVLFLFSFDLPCFAVHCTVLLCSTLGVLRRAYNNNSLHGASKADLHWLPSFYSQTSF